MNRRIIAAAAVTLAMLASTSAWSQAYVSLTGGTSHAAVDCGTDSCNKNSGSFKLVGGYDFGNGVAAELMYHDLGKVTVHDVVDIDLKGSVWGLGGAYRAKFGSGFGGVARIGYGFATGKIDSVGYSSSHQSQHPYFGYAVTYDITKNFQVEVDYDNSQVTHEVEGITTSTTVNSYMIGAGYTF
jgi:predicted porin